MLRYTGEAQESAYIISSVYLESRGADAAVEYLNPNDCDNAPAPRADRGGNTYGESDGRSSGHQSSDGSISVEQGAQQGSPNSPTTSVPGPEARYDPCNLFPMIPILTESADTDATPSTRIYKAPPVLLLLLRHPLVPSRRRYPTHR